MNELIPTLKNNENDILVTGRDGSARSGTVGQRIMNAQLYVKRRENKLKQADIAKALNIAKETYCLKENGKRDFTITEARRLAKYFECTLDELFN